MGCAAVLESTFGEAQRRRQRAEPVPGAVAIRANTLIDRFAPLECIIVPLADQRLVIDALFVLRQREGQQCR